MAGQFCQSYNLYQMFFIRAIGIPMGVSEFQWDVLLQKPLEFPYPLGFLGGAEFQWGMENPMGCWNSNGPIGIPRMDLIATQRSGVMGPLPSLVMDS